MTKKLADRAQADLDSARRVLAIEIAAREVLFGGLFVALLLLFGPPTWLRRALPWLGVVYVVYVIWRLSGGPA